MYRRESSWRTHGRVTQEMRNEVTASSNDSLKVQVSLLTVQLNNLVAHLVGLQLQEVEKPAPNDGEILVQIHAASANPLDWHRMRGAPFLVRLGEGLRKPANPRLGADIAGRVEAVGNHVTQFQPGDEVFGDIYAGGFAE
jgi:NADPH:quinone reductase-like Zn-dependent oxidoreductase